MTSFDAASRWIGLAWTRLTSLDENGNVVARTTGTGLTSKAIMDAAIRRSAPVELPELPADFWDEAVPVLPEHKVPVSLRVDSDVLAWFREEGPRYQSRMNAVLRSYMQRARKHARKKSRSRTA